MQGKIIHTHTHTVQKTLKLVRGKITHTHREFFVLKLVRGKITHTHTHTRTLPFSQNVTIILESSLVSESQWRSP